MQNLPYFLQDTSHAQFVAWQSHQYQREKGCLAFMGGQCLIHPMKDGRWHVMNGPTHRWQNLARERAIGRHTWHRHGHDRRYRALWAQPQHTTIARDSRGHQRPLRGQTALGLPSAPCNLSIWPFPSRLWPRRVPFMVTCWAALRDVRQTSGWTLIFTGTKSWLT